MSWFKDGVALSRSTGDLFHSDSFPLVLQELTESDEGNYTCVLEVLLRDTLKYNVTDYTFLEVKGL